MPTLFLRRLFRAVTVIALSALASFLLVRLAPGDALAASLDATAGAGRVRAAIDSRYQLDQPVLAQGMTWIRAAALGDFGMSMSEQRPVRTVIAEALPNTLLLSGTALVLATMLGVTVGTLLGWRPQNKLASIAGRLLLSTYAVPEVVLAVPLLALFGVRWMLMPVGGIADPIVAISGGTFDRLVDRVWHLTLPACVLALSWAGAIVRYQRAAVQELTAEQFVHVAAAKGVSTATVLRRHLLRPALPGAIALIGTMLPVIVGGTVVIEALFSWPGMGSLIVHAIAERDAPLVSAAALLIAAVTTVATLVTDGVVLLLDPRVRASATA